MAEHVNDAGNHAPEVIAESSVAASAGSGENHTEKRVKNCGVHHPT
jgi:hypothetical protein